MLNKRCKMEKNIITISKKGNFCNIYNNDCYILYYLFNYKIINNKLGFPINSLPKVITTLENRKINYSINNKEINFIDNNYLTYLNLGREKYNTILTQKAFEEKIKRLSKKQTDELFNLIKRYLDEQQF